MNLHGIVAGAIGAINPFISVTVKLSVGYSTNPDGSRTPTYNNTTLDAQVQALTYTDLVQLDGLGIQGVRRAVYLYGDVEGIERVNSKGGDLLIMPDGTVWLVVVVLEHWPDWCKVAVTLQDQIVKP